MEDSAFRGHALWQSLSAVDHLLGQIEHWAAQNDPNLASIRWIVNALRAHQDPADTLPYPVSLIDSLNQNLAQITGGLTNAHTAQDASFIQAMAPYSDGALQQIAWLPPATNRDPARQASRTFVEYRESVEEALTRLNARASEIETLLAERDDVAQQQSAEAEAKFAALKAAADQLQARIVQDETRLDTAATTSNEAFNQAQTLREAAFTEWLEERDEAFDTSLGEIKTRSQEHLDAITKLHQDVEKVSGKAAGAILARDYGSYSTREWVSGVVAYLIGFAALLVLGGYLIHTVSNVSKDEHVSWQYVALKLGLTATAIAAATVAFQFGGHALSRANTNKRVQLELATIGTFLADVDDEDEVQQAKIDFVNRMFGRAWDEKPTAASDQTVNVSAFGKMVDLFLKAQGK